MRYSRSICHLPACLLCPPPRACARSVCAAEVFSEANFFSAFSVVVAYAAYLPSAQCWALLPLAPFMGRTGDEARGARMDYNTATQSVEVIAGCAAKCVEWPHVCVQACRRAGGRGGGDAQPCHCCHHLHRCTAAWPCITHRRQP